MKKKHIVLRILGLLKSRKREVLFLIALVAVATAFDIAVPLISQRLIDTLIEFFKSKSEAPVSLLLAAAGGILGATLLSNVIRTFYDYRLFTAVTAIEDALKYKVIEKYLQLHVLFHHGSSSGQIIGRIERGASGIYSVLHDIFGHNLLPPLIVFAGVLVTLLFKNIWIALAVLIPLPIYIMGIKRIADRIYEIEKQANDQFEAVAKESYDVAANVLTVKKFYQEKAETEHQAELQAQARKTQYSAERLWKIIENTQTFITTAGRVGVILIGGFLFFRGQSTVGEFVLYITLHNMAYQPLYQLSIVFPRFRRNAARVERLFGILDEPTLVSDKPNAIPLPQHSKAIEFRNVSFRYGKVKRWALKNLNVAVPAGTTVALVGRSGSGKTTFVNLLLRSFDPDEGAITIDGHDLRDVKRESLLNQTAVVPQEVDLFSRSIGANIAYGKPDVSREAVEQAARTALAHDFIMQTEHGYETLVGERGIRLSGGERQRVGIARAILRDPQILILDEATSHLDTESERLIAEATNALIRNRTTFIIAHRLSTILHADMILVFKDGELEAVGKHEELLEKSPTYHKLHSLQFSDSGDDGELAEEKPQDRLE